MTAPTIPAQRRPAPPRGRVSIRDTPRSAARLTPRGEAVVAQLLAVRAVARLALDVAAVVGAFLALAALAILLAP